MDLSMNRGKPEILAPAGNFEKMKFAVLYGADAVYFGGEMFNLRDKAGNFSILEIADALEFCKQHNVKTTFLMNSFLHENDVDNADKYIKSVSHFNFDAVMVSDPGMFELVREYGNPDWRIHLSTQMSTLNHLAVKFWSKLGVDRIVLGRETNLDDIKMIREHTDAELEAFVHGALCISYSGRCLLSRFLSGRDANQGACSQPCRWKFALVEEKRHGHHFDIIEHAKATEILSSKDLCMLRKIPEYVDAGVNAFKLEGRMKSLYYGANVTRVYKHLLENYLAGNDIEQYFDFWESELDLISHRPYTDDLFNEFDDYGYRPIPYIKKVLFTGHVTGVPDGESADIRVYNPIRVGETLEAIAPIKDNNILDREVKVIKIFDNEVEDDMARPNKVCRIVFDREIPENAILRKRLIKEEND